MYYVIEEIKELF